MNKVEGLHHLAISTANMKEQIEFFSDKLGMELVALYWMHGVKDTWHGFLRLNDESSIAFVCNPRLAISRCAWEKRTRVIQAPIRLEERCNTWP